MNASNCFLISKRRLYFAIIDRLTDLNVKYISASMPINMGIKIHDARNINKLAYSIDLSRSMGHDPFLILVYK